jgi:hypothetical protein
MVSFAVSFDYRCPFAKNIHLHLVEALRDGADFDVTFLPWTLSQGHRAEGEGDVWDNPARDGDHAALAAGISVRDLQGELFLDVHAALFRARHEGGRRLADLDEVLAVLAPLGVDVDSVRDDVLSRRPHQIIGETYRRLEPLEAFGVPTFVIGDDAVFVRYMIPPATTAVSSRAVIDGILTLMTVSPAINEFKHTKVPF